MQEYRRLQIIIKKLMISRPPVSKSITKSDMELAEEKRQEYIKQ